MSDVHVFTRTFLSNGSPVQADPDLKAVLYDPLGRKAGEFALADGGIAWDGGTQSYSFQADLASLPAGAVRAEWYARKDGERLEPWPAVEVRPRPASHERWFGAGTGDVLERLRGLDFDDLSPLWTGAEGGGEEVLERFLTLAEGRVLAALPGWAFRLLTSRRELVTASSPDGVRDYALHDAGERIVSCAVFTGGAGPLSPSLYSLDDHTLAFAGAPPAGSRIEAELTYSGLAPGLLADVTVTLAAAEAALSLCGTEPEAAGPLRRALAEAERTLGALKTGGLAPAEFRRFPLAAGGAAEPGTLLAGSFRKRT